VKRTETCKRQTAHVERLNDNNLREQQQLTRRRRSREKVGSSVRCRKDQEAWHPYAHHQELETICVLLPPMACDALVAGYWSGAEQPAMRPGRGMLLDYA